MLFTFQLCQVSEIQLNHFVYQFNVVNKAIHVGETFQLLKGAGESLKRAKGVDFKGKATMRPMKGQ